MQTSITRIIRVLSAAAFAIGLAVSTHAQVINTAPLSGVVLNSAGQPVAGAKVTITNMPTATVIQVTTDARGNFSREGLRPGGPYTVEVEAPNLATATVTGIDLAVESGAYVPVTLSAPDVVQMEKLTVRANATSMLFDPMTTDKNTFINNREIQDMVRADRTIGGLLAGDPNIIYNRSPAQQSITVDGINNRYNQIMVDGVSVSDPFGMNSNNMAAQNNVIPLSAVQGVSVSSSPYNVRKGGFTGAFVNVVTKSGGNDFHGQAFYSFQNQGMAGQKLGDTRYPSGDFKNQTYGIELDGPIIPKKLFFMIDFEQRLFEQPPATPMYPLDDGTMQQLMDGIATLNSGVAANGNIINTGTVPLKPGSASTPNGNTVKDTTAMAKLTWQVDDNNTVVLGYKYTDGTRPTYPGFSSNSNSFSFSNSWYNRYIKNTAFTGEWDSHWSDKLYTELSVSYSKYESTNSYDNPQPEIIINGVPVLTATGSSSNASVTMGTDYSYQLNYLSVKTKTGELFAQYKLGGGHTLEGGIQFSSADAYNIFVQNNAGYYVFNTWAMFTGYVAGTSQQIYTYRNNALVPGVDPSADFTENRLGVYLRDNWRAANNLNFDIGVRLDDPIISSSPAFNKAFYDSAKLRAYYNNDGFRNDTTYDGQMVIQPRIGFNWQPKINDGKYKTTIRGGAGLFMGSMPRVFLGNSYSNTGFNYTTYNFTGTGAANPNYPVLSTDPKDQPTNVAATAQQTVNFISPDFKLPTRWKANIAIDQELPWWGMVLTAELNGSKVVNDIIYKSINIKSNANGEAAPDGRPMYWAAYNATTGTGSSYGNAVDSAFSTSSMEMLNTNKGSTDAFTLSLKRPMKADGWQWMIAYVNTHVREVGFANAQVASSNWNARTVFDPNNSTGVHRGDAEVRNRYMVTITKKLNLFSFGTTTITLTGNRKSGLPYSLVATNDVNGDGNYNGGTNGSMTYGGDIMYVPEYSQTGVVGGAQMPYMFASEQVRTDFYKLAKAYGLKQGATAPINGQTFPWVTQLDIHIAQEVKIPGWRHSIELAFDMLNLTNLLNSKWGVVYGVDENYVKTVPMASMTYNKNTNSYLYDRGGTGTGGSLMAGNFNVNYPWLGSYSGEPANSRWSMMLTATYKF